MLEIQMSIVNRAERDLKALGLDYAIRMPDGAVRGTLTVEKQKKHVKVNDFTDLNLNERIAEIEIGDVGSFDIPQGVTRQAFQSRLCGAAHVAFGKQNYTTATVGNQIQVLRLE